MSVLHLESSTGAGATFAIYHFPPAFSYPS